METNIIMNWVSEADYIHSVNPKNPGINFNNNPACFARYCNMQANEALKDGFVLISQEILQCRDIAVPTFRSQSRELGLEVNGLYVNGTSPKINELT